MKSIETKLMELPIPDVTHIQTKLKELWVNAFKKDYNIDLSSLLKAYNGRFDKYFADIVEDCKTSVVIHNQELDEYHMINKSGKCINLSALCNKYKRLPLSDWLDRYALYYFDIPVYPDSSVKASFDEDINEFVFEMTMQTVQLAQFNKQDVYEFIELRSKCGEYEPLELYYPKKFELNEFHIMMFALYHFLLRNPIRIEVCSNERGDKEIFLEPGFEGFIPLLDMYDSYRETSSHPLAIMEEVLADIDNYIFRCLNSNGTI